MLTYDDDRSIQYTPGEHMIDLPNTPITFDTFDDPEDPLHWTPRRKLSIVITIALLSVAGQMASSILAPSAVQILADFNSHGTNNTASAQDEGQQPDPTLAFLVVTSFLLGMAAGLLLTSGLSETYGRASVIHTTNALTVALAAAAAAAASAPYLPALFAFCTLQGVAAAAPPAVGSGVIGDMIAPRERGRATGVYGLGLLLGPTLGPVVGGYVAQGAGWRWSGWVMAIVGAVLAVGTVVVLRESYRPLVFERKVRRLRRKGLLGEGEGAVAAGSCRGRLGLRTLGFSVVRPIELLFTSPLVSLPALGLAVIFGIMFLVLSTISTLYQEVYGWDVGASGLPYLGLGLGLFLGLGIYSATADRVYRNLTKTMAPTPEMRLVPTTLGSPLAAIGLVIYGWSFEKQLHWSLPIIGCIVFCQGMIAFIMPVTKYLIDTFHAGAAGPVGAASVLRCLAGGLLPLCAERLYARLGYGWGNSILALIALVFTPFPYLFLQERRGVEEAIPR